MAAYNGQTRRGKKRRYVTFYYLFSCQSFTTTRITVLDLFFLSYTLPLFSTPEQTPIISLDNVDGPRLPTTLTPIIDVRSPPVYLYFQVGLLSFCFSSFLILILAAESGLFLGKVFFIYFFLFHGFGKHEGHMGTTHTPLLLFVNFLRARHSGTGTPF